MTDNPKEILAHAPMGAMQIIVVVLCVCLNALDGFDVLSISFASPGIAADWGIDRAALGIILSAELIGMGFGSVIIGGIADMIGRRPAILGCLVAMTIGMYMASTSNGMSSLLVYRLITGLGIGGMLASVNAMTAEYSNAKRRNLAVAIMVAGYPAGAIIGGSIASILLVSFDWRAVFIFGGAATAALIPLVWFLMPESIEFLAQRRPAKALEKINATLGKMGHGTISALPEMPAATPKRSVMQLFSPNLVRTTALLTIAYFAHIMTFYFTLKWIPKIVVDFGFAPSAAGGVLVWANVGGITGSVLLGLLTQRFGIRGLVVGAMLLGAVMVAWFGQDHTELSWISFIAAAAGFFTNAAIVGLYAMLAQSFPTELRASGTGFVIGIGRGGAALGPIIAGFLFVAGAGLPMVALMMASGSLIAAILISMLRYRESSAA